MTPMKDVLRNIIYDSDELCGLCFKTVGENAHCIQNEIYLEELHNAEEMQKILSYVLGSEIDCVSAMESICETCIRSAINSYKFIKMCKDNLRNLSTAIDALTGCLRHTTEDIEYYKTVYLAINTNDTSSKQIYDDRRSIDIKSAIGRLRTLSTNRLRKGKQNNYADLDEYMSDSEKPDVSPTDIVKEVVKNGICTVLYAKNGTKTFQCNSCLKIFTKFCSVDRHNVNVHGVRKPERRPYQRLINSKKDADERKNRICTMLTEDDAEKYKCNDCPAVFKTYRYLQCHYSRFHFKGSLELLICSQCGKTFKKKYSLQKHELMHSNGDSRVSCLKCKKVYNVNYFKVHLCNPNNDRIITSKTFVCDVCGKKYCRKDTLQYHIEYVHNEKKGFVCMWCEKKFPTQGALKGHIVTHTKERNFKCQLCGGLFVTNVALKTHTRIHTGEKPYACEAPGCGLRFISASRRSEHYKRRHMEPSLECDICHKIFCARPGLLKHLKRHYNPRSGLYAPKVCI